MLNNLYIIFPVFLLVGAGYLAVKRRIFSSEHAGALMKFAQSFAIPALLFSAVARLDLSSVFQPKLLFSFYIGNTATFIIGAIIASRFFQRSPGEAVAVGFCGMFSNSVLLGLPIIERAYGNAALYPVYAIIAIHAPYCYMVGITVMETVRAGGRSFSETLISIAKEIFSNSLTIAILLGFAVNLSGLSLPGFVWSPIDMIVTAAIPTALFALGGILVRYTLTDRIGETLVVLTLKLFIHPGIVYVLGTYIFELSETFLRAAVITAAMAPGINVYLFASIYDRAKGTAANTILLGTALSTASISIWLFILEL